MALKEHILRIHWILTSQFGFDVLRMVAGIAGLPRYLRDLIRFRRTNTFRLELKPCLLDWSEEGGVTNNEYFWQDLIVARMVHDHAPIRHVDIGSRIDGFVAHVASFRRIEVYDIRKVTTKIPGIVFVQADFMDPNSGLSDSCDSVSCLHALEHFGLGRYGDPITANGVEKGLESLARILRPKGRLYLSVPVGIPRVEFNANRVLDPNEVVRLASKSSLNLAAFQAIDDTGHLISEVGGKCEFTRLAARRYALAIFTFEKQQQ